MFAPCAVQSPLEFVSFKQQPSAPAAPESWTYAVRMPASLAGAFRRADTRLSRGGRTPAGRSARDRRARGSGHG
jgi:hypothetical protein